jgi:amidase
MFRRPIGRRQFLKAGAVAAAGAAAAEVVGVSGVRALNVNAPHSNIEEATIAELQAEMRAGKLTSASLVRMYLDRIDALNLQGPTLRAVIETNPDALEIAQALDDERKAGHVRGPMHGIPILLKDNIDTLDKMQSAAGSLALVGSRPARDAFMASQLRKAGAVILGKANLSEWANFRSTAASSGWSGRGGQCRNPYVLDRNPSGSSSGSAASVAANLVTVALGTETDGSITSPASCNCVVGIKPTVGLTSRAGVVPISHTQDTVGPHGRTVADAATVLGAIVGVDPNDPATAASAGKFYTDYTQFLDPNGLKGARIGVPRSVWWGYQDKTDAIGNAALQVMQQAGATIVDPADIPNSDTINSGSAETTVLLFDFKHDLNAYLAGLAFTPVQTLADIIAFDQAHAAQEMPFFGQELFIAAEATDGFSDPTYQQALQTDHQLAQAIIDMMDANHLDALVAPTNNPAWPIDLVDADHFLGGFTSPAAIGGMPLINVPAGFSFGLPVGMNFMGRPFSEPLLIKLAYAYEQASKVRQKPQFLASTPNF